MERGFRSGSHQYARGIGAHAASDIRVALGDSIRLFKAVIGVDDEVGDLGALYSEVWVDGERAYQSPVMKSDMPGLAIRGSSGRRA